MKGEVAVQALGAVGVFSSGIMGIPQLDELVGARRLVFRPSNRQAEQLDCVAGWGFRPTAAKARAFASRHGLPYLALEDGFLRSLDLGVKGAPPWSLVVDDLGIYYDGTRPSRLEAMLGGETAFAPDELSEARQAIGLILGEHLSKYNAAPLLAEAALPRNAKRRVLILDQTLNDQSVLRGLGDAGAFQRMCLAAQEENPGAEVFAKLHPDTLSGHKAGYLAKGGLPKGVQIIDQDVNPISLLQRFDQVYTVSSQLGFEALLVGRQVVCFGLPFYAGWGLTDDRAALSSEIRQRRQRRRSLEEVFAAAYLRYARYLDPVRGERCDIFRLIEHLARVRRHNEANRGTTVCFAIQRWKRAQVEPYLASTGGRVIYARTTREARRKGAEKGARIVIWGNRDPAGLEELAADLGAEIGRMEDGFIRSAGLGSNFIPPHSQVIDWKGIYYDPGRPSQLEAILLTGNFTPELKQRAARLRQSILAAGISKYNLGADRKDPPRNGQGAPRSEGTGAQSGRRVLLVPGQVEDDASIRLGCPGVATNLALLERVRRENPDACLLFKEHPDIVAGNRPGRIAEDALRQLCDEIVSDHPLRACLERSDEVHTMTSLTGFEALLHGKTVVTYGQPFYAGWGLTVDLQPVARRQRTLTLEELVAGTLILYPSYYDWQSGQICDCETVIDRLAEMREPKTGITEVIPKLERRIRKGCYWLQSWGIGR